jgi:hypothetical protein
MLSSPPWCGRGVCLRTCDIAALNGGSLTRIAAKRRSVQQPALPHQRPSPTQQEVTSLRATGRPTLASARPSSASARRTMPDRQRGLELRRHLRRAHSTHGCQRGKCSFAPAIVLDPCHIAAERQSTVNASHDKERGPRPAQGEPRRGGGRTGRRWATAQAG